MSSDVLRWLSGFDPGVVAVAFFVLVVVLRLAIGFVEEWLARVAWFGRSPWRW